MPSNITGLPHHSHPHHPHHHPSLLPSPPQQQQQQCFQCRSIGGPLLMAATDHDDDNDDHMDHPNPSLKPRYAIDASCHNSNDSVLFNCGCSPSIVKHMHTQTISQLFSFFLLFSILFIISYNIIQTDIAIIV